MASPSANRKLVKNTAFLYVRSLLMMGIGLFSSRIILQVLGVDDYGLFSVVGSVVTMFVMINGVLAVGTSRFLTYELGVGNEAQLRKVFSAAFTLHAGLALGLFILMETLGLWFLNTQLNIEADREFAANVVYQFSVFTSMLSLTQVPYGSVIIAHEKMDIFAYVGIAEVCFKLVFLLVLLYVPFADNLIAFAAILAVWSTVLQIFYRCYCRKKFAETKLCFVREKPIYREMLSYSFWDFLGQFCAVGCNQGLNILINIFFGVVLNASRGIAYQVEGALTQFSGNFLTALQPQIVKSYARGDEKRFFELITEGGCYAYYLLFMVSLPLFLEAEYVLKLWLVEPPLMSVIFLRFVMLTTLMRAPARPLIQGVHATGKIKVLNMTSGLYTVVTYLPAVYILFRCGGAAWSYFFVLIPSSFVCTYLEMRSLYLNVPFPRLAYIRKVYLRPISVSSLAVLPAIVPLCFFEASFLRLLMTCGLSVVSTVLVVLGFGMNRSMRQRFFRALRAKFFPLHSSTT